MQKWALWQKRAVIIGVVVLMASLTAFLVRFFDQEYEDDQGPFVAQRVNPSDETITALLEAPQFMEAGNFAAAVATYEEQLSRLNEIPLDQVSSYFGDVGIAHYYLGQELLQQDDEHAATEHFLRAAFMFEQATETAHQGIIIAVAEYYRTLAYYGAKSYGKVRDAGEAFLSWHPEVAIELTFLPSYALGLVKEMLAVSYFTLSETADVGQADILRANGLRYAEQAIDELPETVIQPHYFVGMHAYENGDTAGAKTHLGAFIDQMNRIPQSAWDPADWDSVQQARTVLSDLQ